MRHASTDEPQQLILQNKITASGSQSVKVQAKITDDSYAIKLGYVRSWVCDAKVTLRLSGDLDFEIIGVVYAIPTLIPTVSLKGATQRQNV